MLYKRQNTAYKKMTFLHIIHINLQIGLYCLRTHELTNTKFKIKFYLQRDGEYKECFHYNCNVLFFQLGAEYMEVCYNLYFYMSAMFHNSFLMKAINDQCREYENAVKSEVQKYIEAIFTAMKKNIKIYSELITAVVSEKWNWGKSILFNFMRCFYLKTNKHTHRGRKNLSKNWQEKDAIPTLCQTASRKTSYQE